MGRRSDLDGVDYGRQVVLLPNFRTGLLRDHNNGIND